LDSHNDFSFIPLSGLKEEHRSSTHKSNSKNLKQKTIEIYSTLNECFIETPHLVDCLFDYLINSRYGLKEVEILDLLYLSALNLISVYKANNLVVNTANSKQIFNYTIYPSTSEINMNYLRSLTPLVWYTFKYNYFFQLKNKLHLFETYTHHNQLYYRFYDLNIKRKFHKYLINNQNQANNCLELSIIDKRLIIFDYFNLNISEWYLHKLTSTDTTTTQSPIKSLNESSRPSRSSYRKISFSVLNELRLPVTIDDASTRKLNEQLYQRILLIYHDKRQANLVTYRMHQEANLHYYHHYKYECKLYPVSQQPLQQQVSHLAKKQSLSDQQLNFLIDYLKNYLINFDWFLSKVKQTNIWFYFDDLEYYKFYLQHLSQFSLSNSKFKQLNEEFILFEKCLFKILYALNNDINQIYVQLYQALILFDVYQHLNSKYLIINEFFCKLKQYYEKNFMLYPLNLHVNCDNRNIFTFDELISYYDHKKCILSYVSFVKNLENYAVTLSKTKNEIKIWDIEGIAVVRAIKLNKPARDIRFIDSYKVVLLLDRNLYLFDLNKCELMKDLRTTLDSKMPFFDLRDQNNMVCLDRNRLSVTLMKLPWKTDEDLTQQQQQQQQEQDSQKKPHRPNQKQFKAGEDRYMNSLTVSKNGKIMACGDQTQKPSPLIVWNLFEQKLIYDFRQPKHEFITTIQSISSNGKYLVCACRVCFFF
jgi:hypothetical protein